MLGRNLFKIDNNVDLSNDEVKSLSLFYRPLIGSHAYSLYMNLVFSSSTVGYKELNSLCVVMNISIDKLENCLSILNKYKLVKTLKAKDEDKYIFITNRPLTTNSFIKDELYVRNFILKVGGPYYQELLSSMNVSIRRHEGFMDVSTKLESDALDSWTKEDESYLKLQDDKQTYQINSFFDINVFLKDVSLNLLPLKYRTLENLSAIASFADLYSISYDKMRTYLPRVCKSDSDKFDLNLLKSLCMSSLTEYKELQKGTYNSPCVLFLMNLQNGKEVTEYDRKIIYNLSNNYGLNPSVINVLLEHCLNNSDNRLVEKYVYQLASDLHRNDIKNAEQALNRLDKFKAKPTFKEPVKQTYEDSKNKNVDLSELEQFLKDRNNG